MKKTINVRPWGDGQGDFVVINEDDFDPLFHVRMDEEPTQQPKKPRKQKVTNDGSSESAE